MGSAMGDARVDRAGVPELPEVESVRRMLEPLLVGATVQDVVVRRRDVICASDDPPGGWSRSGRDASPAPAIEPTALRVGQEVTEIRRHGKALAIVADTGRCVVVHLGMTGWVGPVAVSDAGQPPVHTHVIWTARRAREPRRSIGFEDARRFGGLWCLPDLRALEARWSELGPDALTIRANALRLRAQYKTTTVKASLLDQRVLAGVGNIYADEALFRSKIAPSVRCCDLEDAQWALLAGAVRHELRLGLKWGGATVRSFRRPDGTEGKRQNALAVYGRAGEPCKRCKQPLSSAMLAQRTTVWCSHCQH